MNKELKNRIFELLGHTQTAERLIELDEFEIDRLERYWLKNGENILLRARQNNKSSHKGENLDVTTEEYNLAQEIYELYINLRVLSSEKKERELKKEIEEMFPPDGQFMNNDLQKKLTDLDMKTISHVEAYFLGDSKKFIDFVNDFLKAYDETKNKINTDGMKYLYKTANEIIKIDKLIKKMRIASSKNELREEEKSELEKEIIEIYPVDEQFPDDEIPQKLIELDKRYIDALEYATLGEIKHYVQFVENFIYVYHCSKDNGYEMTKSMDSVYNKALKIRNINGLINRMRVAYNEKLWRERIKSEKNKKNTEQDGRE